MYKLVSGYHPFIHSYNKIYIMHFKEIPVHGSKIDFNKGTPIFIIGQSPLEADNYSMNIDNLYKTLEESKQHLVESVFRIKMWDLKLWDKL